MAALVVLGIVFVCAIALGILARRGHAMTLEQWSVGGRGFGGVLVFVLMAGEISGFLVLPPAGMSSTWFISTVLLTTLGLYMWPQFFAGVYTARSEAVFRKNAVVLPLYQLIVLFVFFVGFAAVLVVPGLKGSDADLSLFRIVKHTFDPWLVGLIGGAGLLTALVPGSMLLITAATILAKNVYGVIVPSRSEHEVGVVARSLVPALALLALG